MRRVMRLMRVQALKFLWETKNTGKQDNDKLVLGFPLYPFRYMLFYLRHTIDTEYLCLLNLVP